MRRSARCDGMAGTLVPTVARSSRRRPVPKERQALHFERELHKISVRDYSAMFSAIYQLDPLKNSQVLPAIPCRVDGGWFSCPWLSMSAGMAEEKRAPVVIVAILLDRLIVLVCYLEYTRIVHCI